MAGLSVWHNSVLPADVDDDGSVAPLDALVVLNGIQGFVAQGVGGEVGPSAEGGPAGMPPLFAIQMPPDVAPPADDGSLYLDVDGDGNVSAHDYGAVVDALAGIIAAQVAAGDVTSDDHVSDGAGSEGSVSDQEGQPPVMPLPDDDESTVTVDADSGPACGVLPATAGPATFNKYQNAAGQWIVGTPAFTPLNDAQNEGLFVGQTINDASLLAKGRPFEEGNDFLAPLHADSWLWDDTYYAWLEVVGVRTYTRYDLIPGATLSNAGTEPINQTLTLSETKTTGWSVSAGLTNTTTQEIVGKAGFIEAKASSALQKQVTVATMAQNSQTVTKATTITAPPCSVVSLYQVYDVVEVQVDYIQWLDSAFGLARGFTPVRGTFTATSTLDIGHHTQQTGPQAAGGPMPLPLPAPSPAP